MDVLQEGEPGHAPVLIDEALDALGAAPGARLVDGTFGGGGHARRMLAAGAQVLAIDRDPDAVARARELIAEGAALEAREGSFGDLERLAGDWGPIDGLLLDLGVSSFQLDRAERGFSFLRDGPLDMRMSKRGPSCAERIAGASREELAALLRDYGEEPQARKVASAIVRAREERPIETTGRLAAIVEAAKGGRRGARVHPATRAFQALRIWVNDELGELDRALAAFDRIAPAGARLAVITFHSLEDRRVKRFVDQRGGKREQGSRHAPPKRLAPARWRWLERKPRAPSSAEIARNPRARSARLRVAVRTDDAAEASGGSWGIAA